MRFCVRLILLFLPWVLQAQDNFGYAAALIPSELLKDADAIIRQQEIQFEVKSAGEAILRERRVVTLITGNSHYDKLILHYNSFNKLGKIKGKIFNGLGQFVRETGKNEIKDVSAISSFSIYEDSRVKYIDVDYNEYPFTVEFEYEMSYRDLLDYPNWEVGEFGTAVEHADYMLTLPQGFSVQHKSVNLAVQPSETTEKDRKMLRWTMDHIPAVKYEPYGPPAYALLPMIMVSPTVFEAEKYTGSMATWHDFGRFMNQLMDGRDELSPAMKETVKKLTEGIPTVQGKIDTLYRYMQQHMRYVSVQLGIGGWQPFDAQYVETNKYGDCKALSNFMKAMLKEAGIPSTPVLIYAGDLPYEVTEDFATPMFNHMILYVPSQDYWLECTSNTAPANYLSNWTSNRNVLMLTETGGKLFRTPPSGIHKNLEENEITIRLQPDGQAMLEVNSKRRGSKQDWYRHALQEYSREDLRKELQENITLPGFTFDKLAINPSSGEPETTVNFTANIPRYASRAGKRLFIPFNSLSAFKNIPPANENRLHPVVVQNGYSEADLISLMVPEGYTVESIPPADFSLETPFGNYSLKTSEKEGLILLERRLSMPPLQLEAGEYNAWRDFCKEVARMDSAKVVLVEKKT